MKPQIRDQRGAVLILVAVSLFALIGIAALAIDLGCLYMVRNELQNAADAGALAGAANLYIVDPVTNEPIVNQNSNLIACQTATANRATAKDADDQGENYRSVDIELSEGDTNDNCTDKNYTANTGDIQRGHWSFNSSTHFEPNDSPEALSQEVLWNSTFEELDANTDLINAVQVTARRKANPASSFFAHIFVIDEFLLSATAVAYLGFANTINPGEIDLPMAICRHTIENESGELQCNFSRLINSSGAQSNTNTAGWINFTQDTPYWPDGCNYPSSNEVAGTGNTPGLVCSGGNPKPIVIGKPMAVNGGEMEPAFSDIRDCWDNYQSQNIADTSIGKPMPMEATMAVVECDSNNAQGSCPGLPTRPPVKVEIVWLTPKTWSETKKWEHAPTQMEDWSNDNIDGQTRWRSFVDHFKILNPSGQLAYDDFYEKTIYVKPQCEEIMPMGTTGGPYPGVLAKIPVLVK